MSPAGGKWDDLIQRLVSGGIAAGVGLWAMWMGGHPFHLLVAIVTGIMIWELARMIHAGHLAVPLGVLSGVTLFVLTTFPIAYVLPLIFLPTLVGVAILGQHRSTFAMYSAAMMIAALGLVILRDDFGFGWMAWLALVVIASDILGYFAGRFIGGPKFWPKVSPKKAWSGTIAGWVGAALVALFFIWQGQSGFELVAISVAVAIAGQLGDVAESAVKRRMEVKDSSSIIPGHGGMFDRFDSMLGASIFLLLVEQIIDFPPVPVPL